MQFTSDVMKPVYLESAEYEAWPLGSHNWEAKPKVEEMVMERSKQYRNPLWKYRTNLNPAMIYSFVIELRFVDDQLYTFRNGVWTSATEPGTWIGTVIDHPDGKMKGAEWLKKDNILDFSNIRFQADGPPANGVLNALYNRKYFVRVRCLTWETETSINPHAFSEINHPPFIVVETRQDVRSQLELVEICKTSGRKRKASEGSCEKPTKRKREETTKLREDSHTSDATTTNSEGSGSQQQIASSETREELSRPQFPMSISSLPMLNENGLEDEEEDEPVNGGQDKQNNKETSEEHRKLTNSERLNKNGMEREEGDEPVDGGPDEEENDEVCEDNRELTNAEHGQDDTERERATAAVLRRTQVRSPIMTSEDRAVSNNVLDDLMEAISGFIASQPDEGRREIEMRRFVEALEKVKIELKPGVSTDVFLDKYYNHLREALPIDYTIAERKNLKKKLSDDELAIYTKERAGVHDRQNEMEQILREHAEKIKGIVVETGFCCANRPLLKDQLRSCEDENCTNDTHLYYTKEAFDECDGYQVKCSFTYCECHYKKLTADEKKGCVLRTQDRRDFAPMKPCKRCGRLHHEHCALQIDPSEDFYCYPCRWEMGMQEEDVVRASELSHTPTSRLMEERVTARLTEEVEKVNGRTMAPITIRVVSSVKKSYKLYDELEEFARMAAGEEVYPDEIEYTEKSIVVFQQFDKHDIAIFSIRAQEYSGDNLPEALKNLVHITWIDSVKYFQPAKLRTSLYMEIVLAYLHTTRQRGYKKVHLWAVPPKTGEDFLFSAHPVGQKFPLSPKLVDWYNTLFKKGKMGRKRSKSHVNIENKEIESFRKTAAGNIKHLTDVPLCDAGFWIQTINECFRKKNELMNELNQKNKQKGIKLTKEEKQIWWKNEVLSWLQAMTKDKDIFHIKLASSKTMEVALIDDEIIDCALFNSREMFLTMSINNHWEFATLEQAKHSTMRILQCIAKNSLE